ncbi:ParB/RepB/Spo0J family partition protein [Streptomyces sp. NPDC056672]|uniref:ParB/RepB/Spo0J family partition protein n=1 Tax=Streptomyces sp. NPDC056672 TaxID=3345906 RepID=UPI0036B6C8FE
MPRNKPGGSENTVIPAKEIPLRPDTARSREVDITRIMPNPRNLRGDDLWENDEERDETVNSMREIGLIQALVVCTRDAFLEEYPQDADAVAGADFVVMAGHRRLAAAALAGLTKLRIDVQDHRVNILDLLMLEENLKRKALNVFQEGEGYRRLEKKGASHAQIAKQVGKAKSTITKRIALLLLPGDAKKQVLDKKLGVDAAYNLLAALDGQADKVLAAADIMRERRVLAQDAVNLLLAGSAGTTDTRHVLPTTVPPVLPEPAVEVVVPEARPALPADPNPPVPTPAAAAADEPSAPRPVPPEPDPAQGPAPAATVITQPSNVAQDGRAQANAARNQHCRHLVSSYDKPSIDPQSIRVAVTALMHTTPAALTRAHGWLKDAEPDAASMPANSYRDALLHKGDATLIARLAYAVSLAEDELRAANRTRHWDYRDVAYLAHLIEGGYEPAEWEGRHISSPSRTSPKETHA